MIDIQNAYQIAIRNSIVIRNLFEPKENCTYIQGCFKIRCVNPHPSDRRTFRQIPDWVLCIFCFVQTDKSGTKKTGAARYWREAFQWKLCFHSLGSRVLISMVRAMFLLTLAGAFDVHQTQHFLFSILISMYSFQ